VSLYIVTGTDTGVGKTFVTVAVLRGLRERGIDAIGLKPVETGWSDPDASDAAALAAASNRDLAETLWGHFALPAAPSVAARAEGREISSPEIQGWVRGWSGPLTLLEGAGGWLVPFSPDVLFRDLAVDLHPTAVLLVATATLGTINHTLLTAESIRASGCAVLAVVLSLHPDDDPVAASSNAREIQDRLSEPVLIFPDDLDSLLDLFHVEP
jgi:dethiobiotin synthase